jgi:glycerol-3-phosphate dehydrogenase
MKRNLNKLDNTCYDLLVIGGGITGACAVWDAILRGLSSALVDKEDFGAATSAASGKMIHGGLRYMQYGALNRVYQSLHERMIFQKIAPHFVHPLPFLVPTYGHFLKGKELLSLAMLIYDFLALGEKNIEDPERIIPKHKRLSLREVLSLAPGIPIKGLTGGILYYDCQMHSPERLTLSFLLGAEKAGADVANYIKVTEFITKDNRVLGVKAKDTLTGEELNIRAKIILNASGPWINPVLSQLKGVQIERGMNFSKGIHIITRPLLKDCALALTTGHSHAKALIQRGGRHFFIIPWQGFSLIGTTNEPFNGVPGDNIVTENDISELLKDINSAYPAAKLNKKDIVFFYGGLYPDGVSGKLNKGYQGSRNDQIFDHSLVDGIEGLISVIGVKYTMARKLAEKVIDKVFKKLGDKPPVCITDNTSVYGGEIDRFSDFLLEASNRNVLSLEDSIISNLVHNYGTAYTKIISYIEKFPDLGEKIDSKLPIIKAQVVYAVREEMAIRLSDVVLRRTGLGTFGKPCEKTLSVCSALMAKELGWDAQRLKEEIMGVKNYYVTA